MFFCQLWSRNFSICYKIRNVNCAIEVFFKHWTSAKYLIHPLSSGSLTSRYIHSDVSEKPSLQEKIVGNGPGLKDFINEALKSPTKREPKVSHPFLQPTDISGHGRKVYFEVRGCQMNVSDAEIAWSILQSHDYAKTNSPEDADVILLVTCSVRDSAEEKVWNTLTKFRQLKSKTKASRSNVKIGVLGCMAERLKNQLLEKDRALDLVAGPDSYKDLPRLLAISNNKERVVNVLLSHDETYADVTPVSLTDNKLSAFVSIMRGCDNMCSYCIVPFTRGRERSRSMQSILDEVRKLSDQGVKEVTLLGQNVNSYLDSCQFAQSANQEPMKEVPLAKGFHTIYKSKKGHGRFVHLLDKVSEINPEMRIRFTSPHPKDFPDDVLHIIKERPNVCNHLHIPAQCGSSRILGLMRRGYTRETYLQLVENIRSIIPDVSLTSDFITGFCSETEEEFQQTLSLLHLVRYTFCYIFPYSLREKTSAHRNLVDDVPREEKGRRTDVAIALFRDIALQLNLSKVGTRELVLVEGYSRRSDKELVGRADGNTRVIFPEDLSDGEDSSTLQRLKTGDYVEVEITGASSQVLKGVPKKRLSSIREFYDT